MANVSSNQRNNTSVFDVISPEAISTSGLETKVVFNTGTTTIDTTLDGNITISVQWSNALAGNTLSITQGYSKFMN